MNKELVKKGTRFIVVGVGSTAINYGAFYLLYKTAGINYIAASVCGYIIGLLVGLVLNNFWTFESGKLDMRKTGGYVLVYLVSLAISSAVLYLLVDGGKLNPFISNIIAICVSTATNFIGLNFIIYRK